MGCLSLSFSCIVLTLPLLQSPDDAGGILECNFDRGLLRTLQEAHFWQRLQGQTITLPYQVHDLLKHHERLFLLQSHVRRVVKAYNLILDSLAVGKVDTADDFKKAPVGDPGTL